MRPCPSKVRSSGCRWPTRLAKACAEGEGGDGEFRRNRTGRAVMNQGMSPESGNRFRDKDMRNAGKRTQRT